MDRFHTRKCCSTRTQLIELITRICYKYICTYMYEVSNPYNYSRYPYTEFRQALRRGLYSLPTTPSSLVLLFSTIFLFIMAPEQILFNHPSRETLISISTFYGFFLWSREGLGGGGCFGRTFLIFYFS